jgi:hypothetical protein
MLQTDSPSVRPDVVFTEEILAEIARGVLRIPRFQRPFVWKPADMLNLFDSIYKGYPIGSLLLWESSAHVESLINVGPLVVPEVDHSSISYVLDGQQRLSTLFAALYLPPSFPLTTHQDDWKWWIYFDLREKVFTHVADANPKPWFLPMRSVLRTVDFLTEARRLQKFEPEAASDYIDTAEQLAQRIKSYKLATNRIKGTMLEAVDIFSRLNSKGRVMAPDQMISALTYREGPQGIDLANRINMILSELSDFGFGEVNRQMVFRSILAAGEQDIHTKEWNALAANLADELISTTEAARDSLLKAARFLHAGIGVPGDKFLPYSYQMLLLSEFFRLQPHPTTHQLELLRRWFWSTSFSGWFAGANSTNIDAAISEMRAFATGETSSFEVMPLTAPARPYPRRFDARGARIRVLLVVLLQLGPRDPITGQPIEGYSRYQGGRAFNQVFPSLATPALSDPANRVLIERTDGRTIRDLLRSVAPEHRDVVLLSHAIPPAAYAALQTDDGPEFVRIRSSYLANLELAFMHQMGVQPPTESFSDALETDSDGDDDGLELELL